MTNAFRNLLVLFLIYAFTFSQTRAQSYTTYPPLIRKDKIDIVRDQWGVPHIYAPTDEETIYGFMWASCEDDFVSMQKALLLAKGLNGLVSGKEGAVTDYIVQLVDLKSLVTQKFDQTFSPKFKSVLAAACLAVNTYAQLHPDEILVKEAFPVTEIDYISGYVLGTAIMAWMGETLTAIFEDRLPPIDRGKPHGSNGIAIHASRTEDQQNYIAINSHQPLEGPFSWYEAHLVSEEGLNMLGSALIGSITLNHGVNQNIAWAHTLNFPDFFDVYKLEMHPTQKEMYRFDGKWLRLQKGKAKLQVKLKGLPKLTVHKATYKSIHGPVLKTKSGYYAVRGPALQQIGAAEQWYHMMKAKNLYEFKKVLSMQQIPAMNIVYADRFDSIFYISNGLYPAKRDPRFNWRNVLPGDTSLTLWPEVYLPLSEIPQYTNPTCGYLFNTNHSPFLASDPACNLNPADFNPTMGNQLRHFNRSKRFYKLVDTVQTFTWNTFLAIKYDLTMPDTVVFITEVEKFTKIDTLKYPDLKESVQILSRCERNGDTNNRQVALFLFAFMDLQKKIHMDMEFTKQIIIDEKVYVACLRGARDHMRKHFGALEVPLGKVQRLRRGTKDYALNGLPDVMAAMYCGKRKDGTLQPEGGESYIMLVKMGSNGIEMHTVNAYGSSNKPNSPHYTDQMELFVKGKTKPMTFNRDEIYKQAERIYHPQ